MEDFNEDNLGGGVDELEVAVVLEGGANDEASAAAVFPCLAGIHPAWCG